MGNTAKLAIPYPAPNDLVTNGATAMQALAEGVDSKLGGAWIDYTPAILPAACTINRARYRQVGNTVDVQVSIALTAAPGVHMFVGLPVPMAAYYNDDVTVGQGDGYDVSTPANGQNTSVKISTNGATPAVSVFAFYSGGAQYWAPTIPFLWASGDVLRFCARYEVR